ncbi:Hypothetical_protein [Hexamita inflata]|uniref:Hypothetical_protein n=1 Tax=Hexamita inflata TaxID=28002 RepID=A0ABP1LPB6_9EUKA
MSLTQLVQSIGPYSHLNQFYPICVYQPFINSKTATKSKQKELNQSNKSFNKILSGNQKIKRYSFTGQQSHSSYTKQQASEQQNIKQYEKYVSNNTKNDIRITKTMIKVKLKETLLEPSRSCSKKLTKDLVTARQLLQSKQQQTTQETFNSINEYRYDDVKSQRNDDSFMYVKIPTVMLKYKQTFEEVIIFQQTYICYNFNSKYSIKCMWLREDQLREDYFPLQQCYLRVVDCSPQIAITTN